MFRFAIALVLLATCSPALAAAGVDLAPKWTAGAEAVFTFKTDATRTDAVPAFRAKQEQRTRQSMTIRRKVVETGPEGTTLELVFTRISVVAMSGRMFMRYDSADPPDPERSNDLEDVIVPLLNTPIQVVLDAGNRVIAVKGLPTAKDAAGNAKTLVVDDETMRNSLAPLYGLGRDQADVGANWFFEERLPGGPGAALLVKHKRTLASAEGAIAKVTSVASAEFQPTEAGRSDVPLLAEFECTAETEWNVEQGRLNWYVLRQNLGTHGVVQQARSEHSVKLWMTIAAEGVEAPEPKREDDKGAPAP